MVGGLELNDRLMAGEGIQAHPVGHAKSDMHEGLPAGPPIYHADRGVFEAASRRPHKEAALKIALSRPGHPGFGSIPVERMKLTGREAYGRYVAGQSPTVTS
ncbi:MAG: hypothetical protein Q8L66_02270 [Caulobacter sp.]|nr:hypothetical protein [Caulobacter sp.]